MRIHKIRLCNIHSLKGEHEVDFDALTFGNNGLFLIIGPTGSGKSSLLDVITLALYNRLPRFQGKISENEIAKLGSVVTHHQSSAYAEVVYSVNTQTYLSRWSITRKLRGAGDFRPIEHELFALPEGKKINDKKSEVVILNEQIIGLKYDQFIKSILLSQGQFANFLHAEKKERTELLTKLTGTDIYSKLGIFCFDWHKKQKLELEQLEFRAKDISLLSEEEVNELLFQNSFFESDLLRKEFEIKELNKQFSVKKSIGELNDKIRIVDAQLKLLYEKQQQSKEIEEKTKKHEALMPYLSRIQNYRDESEKYRKINHELKALEVDKSVLEKQKSSVIIELEKVCNSDIGQNDPIALAESCKLRLKEVEIEISNAIENGRTKRAEFIKLEKLANSRKIYISAEPHKALKDIDLVLKKHSENLKHFNLHLDSTVEDVRTIMEKYSAQKETLKVYKDDSEQVKTLQSKIVQIRENVKNKNQSLTLLEEKIKKLLAERREKIAVLGDLEHEKIRQTEAMRIEGFRHLLKDGEPCPLCGSIEHPWADLKTVFKTLELDVEILNHKKEIDAINNELSFSEKESATLKSEVNHYQIQINELTEEQRLIDMELKQLEKELPFTPDEIELAGLIAETDKLLINIKNILEFHQSLPVWHQWRSVCEEMHSIMEKLKILEERKKALSPEANAIALIDQYIGQYRVLCEKISVVHSHIIKNSDSIKELESLIAGLTSNLTKELALLSYHNIDDAMQDVLEHNQYLEWKKSLEDLRSSTLLMSNQKEKLQYEYQNLIIEDTTDVSMQDLEQKILELENAKNAQNQELGIIRERLRIQQENENKLHIIQKAIKDQSNEVRKWEKLADLIGDSKGNKFSSFAQEITLRRLLALCNRRLQQLSDRYLLSMHDEHDGLYVIDRYYANSKRSVKTLSGGESFLVSLSLALSLSDMASREVKIESMFIDEGFGALDKDTLELAMETLDKIRHDSGKIIGIISHVEALKERIPVQIRLKKDAQDYSRIEIQI